MNRDALNYLNLEPKPPNNLTNLQLVIKKVRLPSIAFPYRRLYLKNLNDLRFHQVSLRDEKPGKRFKATHHGTFRLVKLQIPASSRTFTAVSYFLKGGNR